MPISRSTSPLAALLIVGLLGACQTPLAGIPGPTAAAALPPTPAPAAEHVPDLPRGSGCGPSIAHATAVVDSDVETENLNAAVGERFKVDLNGAAKACAAGREAEAMRLLASAKSRYGYR